VRNLFVAPLPDLGAARAVTHATDRNLSTCFRWAHTNRHLVFFQERDGDENCRASSVDIAEGAIVPLTPERGVKAYWQELDRKFPDEMLFVRDKRYFDPFRINVVTGESELLFENNEFAWYVTDSDFQLRIGVRVRPDGSAEWLERRNDGTFTPFTTVPIGDYDSTELLDFSAGGTTLYILDSRGRDKAALFAVDMASRNATLLGADEEADIVYVDFDFNQRIPLAARANKDRVRWHAVDPGAAQDLTDLAGYGPGDVDIIARSADNRFATVFYERDAESGEYALLDRKTRQVRSLFRQRKALAGLTLQLIHGRPYARDVWGFHSPMAGQPRLCGAQRQLSRLDGIRQSLRHRGKSRMGRAHARRPDRRGERGGCEGFADPKRAGFFGGSYGGYSTLTAATKTPEVFACIVDLFGISNLITFMATIPSYWVRGSASGRTASAIRQPKPPAPC
jgi:hypothetical protein